ncbi:MAG: hypothetical protein QME89_01245 [Actinomycetota bacterium]|nr:hypothetical protein [Actinomycetota bacterium]MDI7251165.1 hypothetical protein [Actinomycetota bacterium]
MKELVDIVSVYLALGLGLVAFWWGLFRNCPLDDCLVRALEAMAVVYVTGLVARLVMALFLAFGGRRKSQKGNSDAGEESRGGPKSEEVREA